MTTRRPTSTGRLTGSIPRERSWPNGNRGLHPTRTRHDPDHVKRHLEVRLPAGRYKVEFRSETVGRLVDIEVPPGDGPLDLPDFLLDAGPASGWSGSRPPRSRPPISRASR